MPPVKRAVAPPPPPAGANFGDLGFYSGGGFGIPEGDYAVEFNTVMHEMKKKDGTVVGTMLAVLATAHPLNGGEPVEEAISMGRGMTGAFVPTEDAKGIQPIPGTSAAGSGNTNWWFLLKSLYDCGLPVGTFENDLSVLDGVHVHLQRIPEPEDRKAFRSNTGEGGDGPARTRTMPVVTEIKEDGKPWEGTGGIPEGGATAPAPKTAPKVTGAAVGRFPTATKPVARKVTAPVQQVEEAVDEADVESAAQNAISDVLSVKGNENGCSRVKLRAGTFTAVKKAQGDDMAQAVIDTYFGSDDDLNTILGGLGFEAAGNQIKVAS